VEILGLEIEREDIGKGRSGGGGDILDGVIGKAGRCFQGGMTNIGCCSFWTWRGLAGFGMRINPLKLGSFAAALKSYKRIWRSDLSEI
jgi:hypothetical protein